MLQYTHEGKQTMTVIPIEEEYGFRHWIWETPDKFESAKARFENIVEDPDNWHSRDQKIEIEKSLFVRFLNWLKGI